MSPPPRYPKSGPKRVREMEEVVVHLDGDEQIPWIRPLSEELLLALSHLPETRDLGRPLELSLVLTDDASIRKLNAQWRDRDVATDVLSFPLEEGPLLGDVVISMDTAQSRVSEPDWLLEDEVLFLLIHGVLHLLGHDHIAPGERSRMESAEQALWTALGRTGTLRAD